MFDTTKQALNAILKSDPSVTADIIKAVMLATDGKATAAALTDQRPLDRALTRAEVADLLKVTPHTVTNYARRGLIRPIHTASAKRAVRYSLDSVRALLAGGTHG